MALARRRGFIERQRTGVAFYGRLETLVVLLGRNETNDREEKEA